MTKLEFLLSKPVRYPEDVSRLKTSIQALASLTDQMVQELYSNWSESYFCAGWLGIDKETLVEFERYLMLDCKERYRPFPNDDKYKDVFC